MQKVPKYAIVLHRGESPGEMTLSLMELARLSGCHAVLLERLVDCGVIEPARQVAGVNRFRLSALQRLTRGLRLKRDLGIGLAALPLVLDLLEQINDLHGKLRVQETTVIDKER
jgi:DNA-binding transcriptional MerR regulator